MSKAEAALDALLAAVAPAADQAIRNEIQALDLGRHDVVLAVQDGADTVLADECGSAWTRHLRRDAGVLLAVRARTVGALRVLWEARLVAIGAALAADPTLGGKVDTLEFGSPFQTEDTRAMGYADMRAGVIPVALYYTENGRNPLEAT